MQAYMERQGYGWMFEVEAGEEEQRPLLEELEIDPKDIVAKLSAALLPPLEGPGLICDFWGPLLVVSAYAALLVWGELRVISWILSVWLLGGSAVFFLARVLGADLTLSHTWGALGYCVLPLALSRLLLLVVGSSDPISLAIRALFTGWATFSASRWMKTKDLEKKQLLLVYPIALYMFYLAALATGV